MFSRKLDEFLGLSDVCVEVAADTTLNIVNSCLTESQSGNLVAVVTTEVDSLDGDDPLLFKQDLIFKNIVALNSTFLNEMQICANQSIETDLFTENLQAKAVADECNKFANATVAYFTIDGASQEVSS